MKRKEIPGIDYLTLPTFTITGLTEYESEGGIISTIAYRVRDGVPVPLFECNLTLADAKIALGQRLAEFPQAAEAAFLAMKVIGSA